MSYYFIHKLDISQRFKVLNRSKALWLSAPSLLGTSAAHSMWTGCSPGPNVWLWSQGFLLHCVPRGTLILDSVVSSVSLSSVSRFDGMYFHSQFLGVWHLEPQLLGFCSKISIYPIPSFAPSTWQAAWSQLSLLCIQHLQSHKIWLTPLWEALGFILFLFLTVTRRK